MLAAVLERLEALVWKKERVLIPAEMRGPSVRAMGFRQEARRLTQDWCRSVRDEAELVVVEQARIERIAEKILSVVGLRVTTCVIGTPRWPAKVGAPHLPLHARDRVALNQSRPH